MFELRFIDACLQGDALIEDIDDYIEKWHNNPTNESIYEFLGMTEEEYGLWVENEYLLKHILFARKVNTPIKFHIEHDQGRGLAARATSVDEAKALCEWLVRTGRIKSSQV